MLSNEQLEEYLQLLKEDKFEVVYYDLNSRQISFDGYQKLAHTTAQYGNSKIYPLLGLLGETGEVLAELGEEWTLDCHKEVGGLMWYVAETCTLLDLKLDKVWNFATIQELNFPTILKLGEIAKKDIRDGSFLNKQEHLFMVHSALFNIVGFIKSLERAFNEFNIESIMRDNLIQLFNRKVEGTIKGDGER